MRVATDDYLEMREFLLERLSWPLPGAAVQRSWEPALSFGRHFGPAPDNARQAAVMLMLIHEGMGRWTIPLTVRSLTIRHHAGQVSLPGGELHPGEAAVQAAIRETQEELCVQVEDSSVVGQLSPIYIAATNFLVTPQVATLEARPDFAMCEAEVQEVLEVDVTSLGDPQRRGSHEIVRCGIPATVPHWEWNGHFIWGTTAMILAEMLALLPPLAVPARC
jgi:8-oxo-dGTP pyrophosphatase MutT (NUDIX family)